MNEHFDQWFAQVAENRYTYKTVRNFSGIIAFDVRPIVGEIKLSELELGHIQRIFNAMTARGVSSPAPNLIDAVAGILELDESYYQGLEFVPLRYILSRN